MSNKTNITSPQTSATVEYLRNIGVDVSAATGAPPELDALAPERAETPKFVGSLNPDFEYFRAVRSNPREVKGLIESSGYVVCDAGVQLDGCSTPDDIILMRRREVGQAIERRSREHRIARRRGGIALTHEGRKSVSRASDPRSVNVKFPEDMRVTG